MHAKVMLWADRVMKERNMWRSECKQHEQYTNQADCSESKPGVAALQSVRFEHPPLKEKDLQSGDIKDSDVDPVCGFSKLSTPGEK